MNEIVGSHNILLMTLDTLRYDVAQTAFSQNRLPNFSRWLTSDGWESRHSPANFTYAAHHAFFAGFLPTPIQPGRHFRLFATDFIGSETTGSNTCVFAESNLVEGLQNRGYATYCIGGVGFFNKLNSLGRVLPGYFQHSFWTPEFGVSCPQSTENQLALASKIVRQPPTNKKLFLFINISALHQPNCFYLEGAAEDCPTTQAAALAYVDFCLESFMGDLENSKPWFCVICSDHGTCYGEAGYTGHRVNHEVVGTVPYADFVID